MALLGACFISIVAATGVATAVEKPEEVLNKEVGVFTELGAKVDLNREFTDVYGEIKKLGQFATPGKPLLIAPVYYKCPRLCGLLLNGVYDLLNELTLTLGEDYSVLVVGFDPTETPADARKVMDKFNPKLEGAAKGREAGVHYLVGSPENVRALMTELGFKFLKDGEDFAHSAAVMILTSTGDISQYFTGIMFPSWDVRLSLIEASKGVVGSAMDHFLLYCFRFDSLKGRYTWAVVSVIRVGGALTLIGLAAVYFFFGRKRGGVVS
jgi:protein SCO1/2